MGSFLGNIDTSCGISLLARCRCTFLANVVTLSPVTKAKLLEFVACGHKLGQCDDHIVVGEILPLGHCSTLWIVGTASTFQLVQLTQKGVPGSNHRTGLLHLNKGFLQTHALLYDQIG